jgi:hypothetical protein
MKFMPTWLILSQHSVKERKEKKGETSASQRFGL